MKWLIGVKRGDSLGTNVTDVTQERSSDAPKKLCTARKRSVSGKCFTCAKAKRQQQSTQRNGNHPLVLPESHTLKIENLISLI